MMSCKIIGKTIFCGGNGEVSQESIDKINKFTEKTIKEKNMENEKQAQLEGLDFGEAIRCIKKGLKVARKGWNGKGMFIELQSPDENSLMTFPYPYFTIPNCEEGIRRIPYASTIVDIMSEDWEIV